jgi:hypothetical protein
MTGYFVESEDRFYQQFMCDGRYINQFWTHFDFDEGDWDDGFGYGDPCNIEKPLCRTLNALYLLAYSAEDYARSIQDFSGGPLRWAYPYSATRIDELDARCGTGELWGPVATTYRGVWDDDRTELKWPFFYRETVVERAGTIVHEARHADGRPHNGGHECPRYDSCDSDWNYYGANTFEALYLWSFYAFGTRTTRAMKNYAKWAAQDIIDLGFVTHPGYTVY